VDARPSDSIAIALRLSAPIFASESLLTDVQVEESTESLDSETLKSPSELNAEQLKEYLERLRPEDFGKFNL
jgi:bifunctional DNase/RNase